MYIKAKEELGVSLSGEQFTGQPAQHSTERGQRWRNSQTFFLKILVIFYNMEVPVVNGDKNVEYPNAFNELKVVGLIPKFVN